MEKGVVVLKSQQELTDYLDFMGDDIVVFMFSSALKDRLNTMIDTKFADLAEVLSKSTKKMRFLAYDLNILGLHEHYEPDHPNMWLSKGNYRIGQPALFRGDPHLEEMAEWLKQHAFN